MQGNMEFVVDRGYKNKLIRAWGIAKDSPHRQHERDSDGRYYKEKLIEYCLQIDHARRIRNLWMHKNGIIVKSIKQMQ